MSWDFSVVVWDYCRGNFPLFDFTKLKAGVYGYVCVLCVCDSENYNRVDISLLY